MSDLRDFTGKNKKFTGTGSITVPAGTAAQEPANGAGQIRYDSDKGVMTYNNGSEWLKISSVLATLTSVTGSIIVGSASTLTLAGEGFLTANLVVNFTQSSDGINTDVTVTPSSDTAASVAVPSGVYNNVTGGNAVTIKVTNSDGSQSLGQDVTAASPPSGGTITTSGDYRIHTFTSSGTFVVPSGLTLSNRESLIVAGGGGGGSDNAGGGGAGGMIENTSETFSSSGSPYTVTVGAGGSGHTGSSGGDSGPYATSGSNSSFNGVTCIGGGLGGSGGGQSPASGGSGGGGTGESASPIGGSGTSGQGNAGGNHANSGGGGGGGKGGAGQNGNVRGTSLGGNGGAGASSSITGSSVNYAGGGGGSNENSIYTPISIGGSGVGGNSNPSATTGATAGTANRGGGGGGVTHSTPGTGGNGGSGIVVIRYQL